MWPRGRRGDAIVLLALLALAAVLRFLDLPSRGTWDGDQAHDMLVLRTWVQDGVLPLLGPPTSIGDVHHGAWYYYLLAPPAFLTGGDDPTAVVAWIAVAGVAAVGVVWWLARSVAGPLAGAIAGLLLAVSTAAVEGSTFIWNPNLIALSSAVALLGVWRGWTGGSAWWWLVAGVGTAVTMQCHVLGIALLPVVLVPLALDLRRRPRRTRGLVVLASLGVLVVAYLPLLAHELSNGFSETEAFLAYLREGRDGEVVPLALRLPIVGLRVVSWPLVGLIADAFVPAVLVTAGVLGLGIWLARDRSVGARSRQAARWLGPGLLWTVVALALAAPSLAVVIRGLPNDHYHAFADPMVLVLTGAGLAGLVRSSAGTGAGASAASRTGRSSLAGPLVVGGVLVALVGWNLTHLPPATHPDGGWPAGDAAGGLALDALRRSAIDAEQTVLLESLPEFKSTEAVAYPLIRGGQLVHAVTPDGPSPGSVGGDVPERPAAVVLLCDDLFREQIGAACGGPAEDRRGTRDRYELIERFEAHPGRWVSVYGPRAGGG